MNVRKLTKKPGQNIMTNTGIFPCSRETFLEHAVFMSVSIVGIFYARFLKKGLVCLVDKLIMFIKGKEMKYAYLDHFTKLWFPYGWKTHKDVVMFNKCYFIASFLRLFLSQLYVKNVICSQTIWFFHAKEINNIF